MFDTVYDFFYGDQLRKHVVLIGSNLLGQAALIPLFAHIETAHYIPLEVALSFAFIWPLTMLYDSFGRRWRRRAQVPIGISAIEKIRIIDQSTNKLRDQLIRVSQETQTIKVYDALEIIERIRRDLILIQIRADPASLNILEKQIIAREEMNALSEKAGSGDLVTVDDVLNTVRRIIERTV